MVYLCICKPFLNEMAGNNQHREWCKVREKQHWVGADLCSPGTLLEFFTRFPFQGQQRARAGLPLPVELQVGICSFSLCLCLDTHQ